MKIELTEEDLLTKIKFLMENQEVLINQIRDLGYPIENAKFNFGVMEGLMQVRAIILQSKCDRCKPIF